jgi:hypothetical protein
MKIRRHGQPGHRPIVPPPAPCGYEKTCAQQGVLLNLGATNPVVVSWIRANRNHCYVPEDVLSELNLSVNSRIGDYGLTPGDNWRAPHAGHFGRSFSEE